MYVHRAIGFMNTNAPARWSPFLEKGGVNGVVGCRVMVELQRALAENQICRSELLIAHHSADEVCMVDEWWSSLRWLVLVARIV